VNHFLLLHELFSACPLAFFCFHVYSLWLCTLCAIDKINTNTLNDYVVFSLFQAATDAEFDRLFTMSWDPNVALAITTELMVMEVVNRIFICIFEVSLTYCVKLVSGHCQVCLRGTCTAIDLGLYLGVMAMFQKFLNQYGICRRDVSLPGKCDMGTVTFFSIFNIFHTISYNISVLSLANYVF